MPHDVTLISTIAIAFMAAFVLGYIASRFRLPPLIGYLLAGVVIGPFTPGFVADSALAGQLAEIGVILLMFGVGLHFSMADLIAVRRLAIPGAIGQIVAATLLGLAVTRMWGWTFGAGLVFSISLSVASTVVLLKALEERNAVSSVDGRVAVGWLIVEDLAMVLVLVLLPAAAGLLGGHPPEVHSGAAGANGPGQQNVLMSLGITLARVVTFGGLILLLGPRFLPWVLRQVARTGSRELFTLAVLTLSIGIAFASAKLFGVSFALGAFFAGMVLNESDLSHKAAANSLPLQDAFAVLFFVSVGMLFDPAVIAQNPGMLLMTLLLILVGKFVIALGIVLVMGYPMSTALSVSAALSQVGEFSFILAGLGISHGLLPKEGLSLILGGAIFSISVNPVVFWVTDRLIRAMRAKTSSDLEYSIARIKRLTEMEYDLESARLEAEKKAGSHEKFTPQQLIERFPMFSQLSPEQREVLLLHFEQHVAQPGERVIRAGDKADAMYFISTGEVEVGVANSRIKLGPGTFFGEMALLSGEPRTADVTALDYCKFLKLKQSDFGEILRRYPDIRRQVIALAGERKERNRQLFAQAAVGDRDEVAL